MIWSLIACSAFALAALVLGVELVGERARRQALEQQLDKACAERGAALALLSERRLPRSAIK